MDSSAHREVEAKWSKIYSLPNSENVNLRSFPLPATHIHTLCREGKEENQNRKRGQSKVAAVSAGLW